jgi:hypothetical protein
MVLWSVVSALALLVAGWYGRDLLTQLQCRLRHVVLSRKRQHMSRDRDVALNWVNSYYQQNDPNAALFRLPNGRLIPYLTKPEWRFPLLDSRSIHFVCSSDRSAVRISRRTIARRRRRGERIWDGQIYCLRHGIIEEKDRFRIDLGRGTYFQYVTVVDQLTQEATACARSRFRRPVRRDASARSIWDLQSGRPGAQLVGFAVAFLFASATGWRVLIQRRSFETGIAADLQAVIPAFVIEPAEANGRAPVSPFHDFLREVSEELYASRHHADGNLLRDDWYLENEDVQRLRQLHDAGTLQFDILGFGFDAVTSELNFAGVAVLRAEDTARSELRRMQVNWEVAGVRAVEIESPEIDDLINSPSLYHTSAFALSCAREWLRADARRIEKPAGRCGTNPAEPA